MSSLSTFRCVSCQEFINTGMQQCRYCSAPIDPHQAAIAAGLQEKTNAACNDASLIRNMAGTMWLLFFIRFVPVISMVGLIGSLLCFFAVPVKLIHWQVKYGSIRTSDADYKQAQRRWLVALALWVLLLVVAGTLEFLLAA